MLLGLTHLLTEHHQDLRDEAGPAGLVAGAAAAAGVAVEVFVEEEEVAPMRIVAVDVLSPNTGRLPVASGRNNAGDAVGKFFGDLFERSSCCPSRWGIRPGSELP